MRVILILSFVLYFTVKAKYSLYIGILSVVGFILVLVGGLVAGSRQIKKASMSAYKRYKEYRTTTTEEENNK